MSNRKEASYGTCAFIMEKMSPRREDLDSDTKMLNIPILYSELSELERACHAAMHDLQSYKRNTIEGKAAAATLVIQLDTGRVMLNRR